MSNARNTSSNISHPVLIKIPDTLGPAVPLGYRMKISLLASLVLTDCEKWCQIDNSLHESYETAAEVCQMVW